MTKFERQLEIHNWSDRPIAVLRIEPDQLRERFGLHFRQDHDDLDSILWASLEATAGRVYALVRHQHAPQSGTELLTTTDSTDFAEDLRDVLDRLDLDPSDVIWSHPSASKRVNQVTLFSRLANKLDLKRSQVRGLFDELKHLPASDLKRAGEFLRPANRVASKRVGVRAKAVSKSRIARSRATQKATAKR